MKLHKEMEQLKASKRPPPSPVREHESHVTTIPSMVDNPGPGAYTVRDGFDENLYTAERYANQVRRLQVLRGVSPDGRSSSPNTTKRDANGTIIVLNENGEGTVMSPPRSSSTSLVGPAGLRKGYSMGHKSKPFHLLPGTDSPGPKYDCSVAEEKTQRFPVLGGSIGKSLRFDEDKRAQRELAVHQRKEERKRRQQDDLSRSQKQREARAQSKDGKLSASGRLVGPQSGEAVMNTSIIRSKRPPPSNSSTNNSVQQQGKQRQDEGTSSDPLGQSTTKGLGGKKQSSIWLQDKSMNQSGSIVLDERSYFPNDSISSQYTRPKGVVFRKPIKRAGSAMNASLSRTDTADSKSVSGPTGEKTSTSKSSNFVGRQQQRQPRGSAWRERIRQEEMRLREEGLVNEGVAPVPNMEDATKRRGAAARERTEGPRFDFGCSGDSHFRGKCSFGGRPAEKGRAVTPGPGEYNLVNDRPASSTSKSYKYMDGPARKEFFRPSTTLPGAPPLHPDEHSRLPNSPAAMLYLTG